MKTPLDVFHEVFPKAYEVIEATPPPTTQAARDDEYVNFVIEIGPEALALAAPFIADNSQLKRALGRRFEAPTSMDAQLADIENL